MIFYTLSVLFVDLIDTTASVPGPELLFLISFLTFFLICFLFFFGFVSQLGAGQKCASLSSFFCLLSTLYELLRC